MKKLLFLIATSLIGYGSLSDNPFPKKDELFDAETNIEYLLDAVPIDLKGDSFPEYVVGFYDLNKNNKKDALAFYPMMRIGNYSLIRKYASHVFVDNNEDGEIDYGLEDRDGNGTLESFVNKEEIKKRLNGTEEKTKIERVSF